MTAIAYKFKTLKVQTFYSIQLTLDANVYMCDIYSTCQFTRTTGANSERQLKFNIRNSTIKPGRYPIATISHQGEQIHGC